MSWGDTHIPVVVNQSSWLPGPSDKRGPSQPMEEGRVIGTYTVEVQGMPLCIGKWSSMPKNNFSSMASHSQYCPRLP